MLIQLSQTVQNTEFPIIKQIFIWEHISEAVTSDILLRKCLEEFIDYQKYCQFILCLRNFSIN